MGDMKDDFQALKRCRKQMKICHARGRHEYQKEPDETVWVCRTCGKLVYQISDERKPQEQEPK